MAQLIDPVAHAAAHYAPLYAADEAQAIAEVQAANEFLKACGKCDANALADWAPMTTDWDAVRAAPRAIDAPMPKRVQTLAEVLDGCLDYGNGPSRTEVMQLLLNVAFNSDLVNQPTQARYLLARMASTWAAHNVTVEG